MGDADDTFLQIASKPQARVSVRFKVLCGPKQGTELLIDQPTILVVGRDPTASFYIGDDPYFSRNHCRLEVSPPRCRLIDLNSTNGTLINGVKAQEPMELVDGDIIGGGDTKIVMNLRRSGLLAAGADGDDDTSGLTDLDEDIRALNELLGEEVPEGELSDDIRFDRRILPTEGGFIGGYQILRELGRGGMGAVYLARHVRTQVMRAIKLVLPVGNADQHHNQIQMFLREANLLLQLKHPRIVEAIELGIFNGRPYLVLEYIDTINLLETIQKQSRPKAIRMACWVIIQVLDALDAAHKLGTVHRDVKPANVLAFRTGRHMQVKLSDFGLAKRYHEAGLSSLTHDTDIRGTLNYMAPEQVRDSRYSLPSVDIYSAAATLYLLLSGRNHFIWTNYSQAIHTILNENPIPLLEQADDIPPALAAIVDRALSRDLALRWPTAAELRAVLKPFAEKQ